MHPLQTGFIAATFAVPLLFWALLRWLRARRGHETERKAERGMRVVFVLLLLAGYAGSFWVKADTQGLSAQHDLPLQLCDWAGVAILLALVARSQTAFEVAYCWGLAGTFQGLLSPAIEVDSSLRTWIFFGFHALIPAIVLWLLLLGLRPTWSSWRRVALWSEIYFATAIAANYFVGGNYGFLSHRPPTRSPLDHFPDPWLPYVLTLNAFALVVFALMLAPWRLARASRP